MKTKQEPVPTPAAESTQSTSTVEVEVDNSQVRHLFHRPIVGDGVPRTLKMRRTLTRPLVSMNHRKNLAVECQGEITTMDLSAEGRKAEIGKMRVFEAKELIPTEQGFIDGDECLVVVHEVMASALEKAGYQVLSSKGIEDPTQDYRSVAGKSLKGALLAFISGNIKDGKRYRDISVAELE